jgi:uncharacterized protein YndB with AHSA1/START domain
MSTDRIEKKIVLRAPRSRVWRAIADAKEFGSWFGVQLEGEFSPGARVAGQISIPGYDHLRMEITIEKVEPERMLSFRWHPNATDPAVDYSAEPTTLVEFTLEETDGGTGTELTVTESGFDRIPAARRAEAFLSNDRGWAGQLRNIERHVSS